MKRYTSGAEGVLADQPSRKKHKRLSAVEEQEEERLTSLLFSGEGQLLGNLLDQEKKDVVDPGVKVDGGSESEEEEEENQKKPAAAWQDDDDEELEIDLLQKDDTLKLRETPDEESLKGTTYEQRLRNQFETLQETPEWAQIVDQKEEDDDILRTTHSLISAKASKLPKGTLKVTKMVDANIKERQRGGTTQVKFHPSAPLLLTAGHDKALRLFHIDGKENTKLQTVRLNGLPIDSAFFTRSGEEVICTGEKPFLYSFDLTTGATEKISKIGYGTRPKSFSNTIGNENYIAILVGDTAILMDARTKQWIANLKANSPIRAGSFSSDSSTLTTCCDDGEAYVWDLKERRCIHRFKDDGAVRCTAIGQSKNNQYCAIGSASGIVNVYNPEDITNSYSPNPLKSISNLTTETTCTKFNHDSQLLGISSSAHERQFRLVHLPSFTVFSNWPGVTDPILSVSDFDFSPHSGFLALGNTTKGNVLLYRLNHFDSA